MDSPSPDQRRPMELFPIQMKRPRFLTPEREPQPMEENRTRERKFLSLRPNSPIRLELSLSNSARRVDKSPADDMARMREEIRMLKEKNSLLRADNRVLWSRLHQMQDQLDKRSSPPSNGSTSKTEGTSSNSPRQRDAPLMGWNLNEEPAPEMAMRRIKVSMKIRADIQRINDGCQWRKYGQKTAKENPCPRSYYRCSMLRECPVRKQVQTCASDRSILWTTYVGQHNHPLPPAAKFVSSITASASEMLLSGSMYNMATIPRELVPFFAPGMVYISDSDRFPTITLDMTKTPLFANPLTRNLQIVEVDQTAMVGPVNETITEAITSNPNFQAVVAAAVSSIMSSAPKP